MLRPTQAAEPIPGYVLKDRVGVGGYGEVWSAEAPGGLAKAVKLVFGYFDDARAARELKALERIKQVRHPFLLSLERFEIVDGQLVIVTELADMSLKDRFEQLKAAGQTGIPRNELLRYMSDAADALDYMRETFSLQHLDVKPENLLLVGHHVKVADFGLVKELQEVTASIMGGMTPVYAPPEVFDDHPSPHSDQYSLAIVYQEMLTGVLPFPGRTPAQLAAQHLHARPRLAVLPPADQAIIGRALAKDPQQRFPSCRDMINGLLAAREADVAVTDAAPQSGASAGVPSSETISRTSLASKTDTKAESANGAVKTPSDPSNPSVKTYVKDSGAELQPNEQPSEPASVSRPSVPQETLNLPPLEITTLETGMRPTLFLGIGGTASRVLRQLRLRLRDRFGHMTDVPAMRMLLLDTDAKNLYQATQGDPATSLSDEETLPLPLRHAQDYAMDSRDILQWLSRRWLYNIPRSLQTEGRRPLGRLALVDHADQVLDYLRNALTELTRPETSAASAQTTGLEFTPAPRVFLLASISGGTGSGMVLDVAYAVRKVLAELGLPADGVYEILTHSTDRNLAASDLAIANAYACLSELAHYNGPDGYPGEAAYGLPASQGPGHTFANTYFLHLGDELNDPQFEAATDALAAYLFLSSVTPTAAVLDRCRAGAGDKGADNNGAARSRAMSLRSFRLASIGGAQTPLATLATKLLCKQVIDHWRGVRSAIVDNHPAGTLIEIASRPSGDSGPQDRVDERRREIEQQAARHAHELELEVERLGERATALVEKELGGSVAMVLATLSANVSQQPEQASEGGGGRVAQLLHAIASLFGPIMTEAEWKKPPSAPLRLALERELAKFAVPQGEAIRQWIADLCERPETRVGGALWAKDWYANHLSALESQTAHLLRETYSQLQALHQALASAAEPAPARGRRFASRRCEIPLGDLQEVLSRLVEYRFLETALHGLYRLLRSLSAQVSAAGDHLKDLQRELGLVSRDLEAASPWDRAEADGPANNNLDDEVTATLAAKLREQMPELIRKVDERLQAEFLRKHGGLRDLATKPDSLRRSVAEVLRAEARTEIVAALARLSFGEILLPPTLDAEQQLARLHACLAAAKTGLTGCGGAQRLLAVVPQGAASSNLQEAVSHQLDPPATVVNDSQAGLTFCYEVQDQTLTHVAARLVDEHLEVVPIADRLHTRSDVVWSKLG